jgi:hypothetical protein
MKTADVPQDENPTYKGYGCKAIYALNENNRYETVPTSGWEVEEIVLKDAIEDFRNNARLSRIRFEKKETSPVEYFMHKNFLDFKGLCTGLNMAGWRVKRHFKPNVFSGMSLPVLKRYADFFKTSVENLKTLCDEPQ